MSLLFNYSAGNLTDSSQLPGNFLRMNGAPVLSPATGLEGINQIICDGSNNWLYVPNVAIPTGVQDYGLIIGAGVTIDTLPGSGMPILCIGGTAGSVGGLGTIMLALSSTPGALLFQMIGGTNNFVSPAGVWTPGVRHYLEVAIQGFFQVFNVNMATVYLDGIPVPGLTNVQCLGQSGLPWGPVPDGLTITTVTVGGSMYPGLPPLDIVVDSVYAADTLGSFFNAPVGPCISAPMLPAAPGAIEQWALGGSAPAPTAWQALSRVPAPGDISYIYSATIGQEEAVALGSLGFPISQVYGLTVFGSARQDTVGGGREIALGLGWTPTGARNYPGILGQWELTGSYDYYGTPYSFNPFTGVGFTTADLARLQVAVALANGAPSLMVWDQSEWDNALWQ